MKKILLLNPPGTRLYVRDYYCSKVSKADYLYHPTDLLTASGWLEPHFELRVMDCIVDQISAENAFRQIESLEPDGVFFITGSVSREEDFRFLSDVKNKLGCLMVGSGDCFLDEFDSLRECAPWLDAIALDFMSDSLEKFFRTELNNENFVCTDIIDLRRGVDLSGCSKSRVKGAELEIPIPRYELFPNSKYRYPFVRSRPFASILTDYGCPWRCKFCVMSEIGFKHRSVRNILEELDYVHRLGFRDIYFIDQTFGYDKRRLKELCREMIDRNYSFRWVAFTRADLINKEILGLMKRAGCHMLMFGIESPVQRILDEMIKDLTLERIEECFRLCKSFGIKTLATFIIGLPGTTYEENLLIGDYAVRLDVSYASFNMLVPRVNTPIRREAKERSWLVEDNEPMDQSGEFGAMSTGTLSVDQIKELHKRVTRKFYLRPSYVLKRAVELRTSYDLFSAVRNGKEIFMQVLRGWLALSKGTSK